MRRRGAMLAQYLRRMLRRAPLPLHALMKALSNDTDHRPYFAVWVDSNARTRYHHIDLCRYEHVHRRQGDRHSRNTNSCANDRDGVLLKYAAQTHVLDICHLT